MLCSNSPPPPNPLSNLGLDMAYAKVVLLEEELDYLIHIPFRLLVIRNLQAKLFIEKVGEIQRILETEGTPNLLDQLLEEVVTLALPIGDFIQGPGLQLLQSNIESIMTTRCCWGGKLSREVSEIVEQLGLIENKLEKFLDETDLYNSWEDLRNNLSFVQSREAVRALLRASQELKDPINFFHDVGTESAVLCLYLRFLLRFLGTLESECSDELVKAIREVVDKALDAVNCPKKGRLVACFLKLVHELLGYSPRSRNAKKNFIDEMTKEFFGGRNGMRMVLLQTLEKLHSFTREIDMICEKAGRDDLQSRNASFSIQPMTYCPTYFPLSKGTKRKYSCKKTSK